MAELPELWTDRTPVRQPTFGVAREAETYVAAPPDEPAARKPRRERGPFVTYLRLPWSYGDRPRRDIWRRLQCRRGRHQMSGGHTMQVDGMQVFVERHCRWCDVE